jgi:hypothetical protein
MSGLKLKYVPLFPSQVIGGAGIDVEKSNGNWTISLDYGEFGLNSPYVPQPGHHVVLFAEDSNGYVAVPVTALGPLDTSPPTAPTSLTAATISSSEIDLSWTASTDNVAVTSYLIEQCFGVGCSSFAQIGTATGTTFSNTGLTPSTSYSYRVRATDAAGNLSGYSNTVTAVTVAGDPAFSNVVLLMGFEGANGSTGAPGLTDESPSAHGTAGYIGGSISTAQFKFGSSSWRSGGIAGGDFQFADSPDWILAPTNASKYTVEGWFRLNSSPVTGQVWLAQWNPFASDGAFVLLTNGTTASELRWVTWYATGALVGVDISTSGAGLTTGQWYHVAIDYDGTKCRLYVNGVMRASATPVNGQTFDAPRNLTIGQDASGAGNNFDGWIDELRITKGAARYASDSGFAVPTAAFPRH